MTSYLQAIRMFGRDLRLFLLATASVGFGFFGIHILLLNLFILRLGYGPQLVGLVNGAAPLSFALVSLAAGAITRRFGFRKMMTAGLAIDVLGLALLPFAEFLPDGWQQFWLVICPMVAWMGGALFVVNASPFLMRVTSQQERNHAFSMQAALIPLAGFAGNLLGGLLPGMFGNVLGLSLEQAAPYRYALWVGALCLIPAVFFLRSLGEIPIMDEADEVMERRRPPYGIILFFTLFMLLRTSSEWMVRVFFNAYLDSTLQVSTSLIGALFAAAQLLGVAALFSPAFVLRWGRERIIGWSMLAMGLAILPLALIPHWAFAGFSFMGVVGLISLASPPLFVLSQQSVTAEWRTVIAGAMTMAVGLSIGGMALGGGYLADQFGYRQLFLIGAGLAFSGALLFFVYRRTDVGQQMAPS